MLSAESKRTRWRQGSLYEFIDDRRADGVDKVDRELQEEYNEEERRHDPLLLDLQTDER